MEQSTGPSDAGELTAGPCDPRVGLAPPTCRNVACTGLLHHLLSGTPTRGGSSLMAKLEHPSSGSVGGAEATTPTLTYETACGRTSGPSSCLCCRPSGSPSGYPSGYPFWKAGGPLTPRPPASASSSKRCLKVHGFSFPLF